MNSRYLDLNESEDDRNKNENDLLYYESYCSEFYNEQEKLKKTTKKSCNFVKVDLNGDFLKIIEHLFEFKIRNFMGKRCELGEILNLHPSNISLFLKKQKTFRLEKMFFYLLKMGVDLDIYYSLYGTDNANDKNKSDV
ncbi:MAG: hypothetical protein ACRCX2_01225 [Paraclostridium sp.]